MKDFDAQVQKLGSVGAALNWARENGYELPPANQELPPVAEQGALAAAAQAADTGEEETMDDTAATGGMGGLDLATLDLGQIKTDPGNFFKSILEANQAAEQRAALSAKQLYDAGRQRIMEKYAGPKRSEQLFALSQAMLSPRDTPGFGGFLANVTGALGANAKAVRDAEQAREEQLLALQQQYQQGEAARMAARPKTAADIAAKYIAATKPEKRRTGFDPITGELKDMDTGEVINNNADLPVLTPEKVAALSRNPNNRGMKFRTTDGRVMEIK